MKKFILIAIGIMSLTSCNDNYPNRNNYPQSTSNDWGIEDNYDDSPYIDNYGGYYNTQTHHYYNRNGHVMSPVQQKQYITRYNSYKMNHYTPNYIKKKREAAIRRHQRINKSHFQTKTSYYSNKSRYTSNGYKNKRISVSNSRKSNNSFRSSRTSSRSSSRSRH